MQADAKLQVSSRSLTFLDGALGIRGAVLTDLRGRAEQERLSSELTFSSLFLTYIIGIVGSPAAPLIYGVMCLIAGDERRFQRTKT
ncbi:hypothetical protein U1Q18_010652 [Sarracenia purpurea var. burkii]